MRRPVAGIAPYNGRAIDDAIVFVFERRLDTVLLTRGTAYDRRALQHRGTLTQMPCGTRPTMADPREAAMALSLHVAPGMDWFGWLSIAKARALVGAKTPTSAVASVLAGGLAVACGPPPVAVRVPPDGAPDNPGPPSSMPPGEPPTGQKWEPVDTDDCGRDGIAWVLVDEVCGGTQDPDYMDYFRAPMFRDGARVGDQMYAVDATYLWVLDMTDHSAIQRQSLFAGLAEPLAVGQYEGRLLIAAGSGGLLELNLDNPSAPELVSRVDLPGPALDVHVEGDEAFVAFGSGGIAVVDLLDGATLNRTIATPGFAAGVTTADGRAYVAACDTVAVIDLATDTLLAQTWLSEAYDGDFLVAPAKDVAVVGTFAFVAAGRFGAVAIDISDPSAPEIVGNCTVADELSFYASGVRANDDTLFVAGGEWGILPVELNQSWAGCWPTPHPARTPHRQ